MYTPGGAYQAAQERPSQRHGRIARIVERILDRLFLAEDANAVTHGWEIHRTPRGRRYRDPRWDTVHTCPLCAGAGCSGCADTGVVRTDPARTEVLS